MPTLFVLNGWKIQMFHTEWEEPHFHIYKAGEGYRFRLRDFEQMLTDNDRAPDGVSRMIRNWALRNQDALQAAWEDISNFTEPTPGSFVK